MTAIAGQASRSGPTDPILAVESMGRHPARQETTAMIEHRPFSSLGKANYGWLDANYHFSFANYRDRARDQWGRLRVWNDDTIAPGMGFDPHPHRDMEIITYVRTGAISHK